jgi:hypothetical protein
MANELIRKFNGTDATATDNVALVTLTPDQCRGYRRFGIQAVAGAVDVEATLDGATFDGPMPLRSTSGVALGSDEVNSAAAATSIGYIDGPLNGLIVRKKGTTNPTTVVVTAMDPIGA